ncbi:hypothetical protein HXZ62_07800 [Empedobacter falsenii]|uniref:Uncharacterized protein n=1 Tax=Empedobacter falsenii TaxID=343874 RepID=A0A7H9DTR0_9FLAO|nr:MULTISPECIES: hypothetical protein [Empedobacter]MDH2207950.1 hypothetical protein [Empedobacter sp. GD03644]MDM1062463.1 hypothetical protein [Empedobacter falsenii]QLL58460.1 hypothetical protein FH779_10330 [Empedobacter falsenii]
MNIFTKLFLTTTVMASSFVAAQQDSINITNLPTTINKDYSFEGIWKISNDGNTSNYKISGGKLTNYSNKTSQTLFLDLYFAPSKTSVDLYNLPNKINTNAQLGNLEGNGTSFNNVIVTFKGSDVQALSQGDYTPILLLKEKESGSILNYKVLSNKISLESNNILIDKVVKNVELPQVTNDNTLASTKNIDATLSDIYTPVESSLDIENANRKVKLSGVWKLEIDFNTLMVTVDGINNSIQNLGSKPTNKLKLLVYFSKQNISDAKEIDGFELLNFDIFPISGNTKAEKLTFTSNITKLVPAGEYYPILVLTEKNDEGNYIIKSTLGLGEKYIWK